jgi:hypothetical protein
MSYKCVHQGCTCTVAQRWMYCSHQCASSTGNATCSCGHPGCKGGTVGGQDRGGASVLMKLTFVLFSAGLFLLALPARVHSEA